MVRLPLILEGMNPPDPADVPDVSSVLPRYPLRLKAIYEDERGRDEIVISNDGKFLHTTLRGLALSGSDFDGLEAGLSGSEDELQVTLNEFGELATGSLTVLIPIAVDIAGVAQVIGMEVTIVLPPPAERVELTIRLPDGRGPFRGRKKSGDFEDELESVVHVLPADVRLLACHTCGLSDYSPSGHGIFGGLACFRDVRDPYRRVASKWDMFELWASMTEYVQETHLCPEWEPRPPGRGYRG